MAIFTPSLCASIPKLTFYRSVGAIACALILLGLSAPAFAEDPFELESTHWMSFDRYKDNVKRGAPDPLAQEAVDKNISDAPAPDSGIHDAAGEAANVTPPTMAATSVAAPTRPINVPVMPGVNKGFNISVQSTEDDRPPVAQITNVETQPTIALPEKNWQTPQEAAQRASSDDDSDDKPPLPVRMSFLPNREITPVPSPEYVSNHGRRVANPPAAAAPEPAKKAADLAACAAVDAYKKKQLEAIQSDRQTLADLQKAIAQMGLQKELSFIVDAKGSVNQADSGDQKMDMPAPSARP